MSNERRWPAYDATPFTANGTLDGVVTVADTFGLYTKMTVALTSNTQPQQSFKVNAVLSPTQVQLGPVDKDLTVNSNLTAFTTADNATIFASRQAFGSINPENITNAVYAREPIVALRTIGTDKYGKYYDKDNPLPVDATVSVVVPPVSVDLDGYDQDNPDSVNITGSDNGLETGVKRGARVDADYDLRVGLSNGANKAGVNASGEVSVVDQLSRNKLDALIASLAATLNVSDTTAHSLLATVISGLASIDAGIPAALGQTTMASSMPVNIASDQTPIPISGQITATLGDEPIKISGTENGQPNGPEFAFVNNRLQQILAAKDRTGTISYADFGTKDQRITQLTYTAPSIGTGAGFTAQKNFTYTLIGNRYRRDTPGNWVLV